MANRNFRQRLKEYKRSPLSGLLFLLVCISAFIAVAVLIFLIIYILPRDSEPDAAGTFRLGIQQ